jgi:hypothetical protein
MDNVRTGEHNIFWDEDASSDLKFSLFVPAEDDSDVSVGYFFHAAFADKIKFVAAKSSSLIFDPFVVLFLWVQLQGSDERPFGLPFCRFSVIYFSARWFTVNAAHFVNLQ